MPTAKYGFILIELMVVVVIILILASIGLPFITSNKQQALVATLHELEELCLCAQYTALASNKAQRVAIDVTEKTCRLTTCTPSWTVTLPSDLSFGWLTEAKGPPGNPRDKITQPVTFPFENSQYSILFQQNGVISPGTIYLCDKDKTLMGALTCGISQVSYVRKYIYRKNQWLLMTP
jgi:prepilin-type N-terminal cleavage/methylation domain-containing protein